MNTIVALLFQMCVDRTIPNPYTIHHLTDEQRQVIVAYTESKCKSEAESVIVPRPITEPETNSCFEGEKDCM